MRNLFGITAVLAASAGASAAPFPGGVLDSTGRTAYVRSSEGIAAIDLARGDVLWHRREANVPLLVAGDRLYALALSPTNRLSVLAFDLSSKAESVFQTNVTDLPRWVSTLDQPGKDFRFRWSRDLRMLNLTWQAQARAPGSPPKKAWGQIHIDLDSGRVRSESPRSDGPDNHDDGNPFPEAFERLNVRWHGVFAGQLVAAVLEETPASRPGARKQQLVFRGWDRRSGKQSGNRVMMEGRSLTILPDLDGKHLWVRDTGAGRTPDRIDPNEQRPWTVFSVLDGHEVARVPFVPGTTAATLVARRAYCLSVSGRHLSSEGRTTAKHTLHAVDLETGKSSWACTLGK